MERKTLGGVASGYIRQNVVGFIALFVALGGSAWAIGANSVGSEELKRNAVGKPHIKKNAVAAAELRRNAVRPRHIRADAVRTRHIFEGAITTPLLADGAVSAEKLAPGVPTQGPPGPTTGPAGGDLAGSYPNPSIGSLRVTTDKLATGAVTTDKLADEFVKGDGEVYANRVVVPAGSRPQVLVVPGFVTLAAEEEGCRGDRADMAFEYPGGINDIWWEQANPAGLFRSGGGGLLLNPATTQRVSQWIGKGTGEDAEVAKVELVWHANGSQCSYVARAIVNR